jgi:hypothetical protein
MRHLVKLIALAYNSRWRDEPRWIRLWLQNTWTTREVQDKLHYRVKREWSIGDKKQALEWARKSRLKPQLRTDYRNFYAWLHRSGLIGKEVSDDT